MSSGLATSSELVLGEQSHGGLGEVAPVGGDWPFVVGLDQHGAGEAEQGFGVGEDPTTSVRRLTSLLSRSSGLVDQIFFQ